MTAAVFLDRDGVLVDELGYLTSPSDIKLIPGAIEALRELAEQGFALVVITNQSAVARGKISLETLEAIHGSLRRRLSEEGVDLSGIYFCPHHPEAAIPEFRKECECRKPKSGLLRRASRELGVSLNAQSLLIGDQPIDIECALGAGVPAVLVRTGKGSASEPEVTRRWPAVPVCDSIRQVPGLTRKSHVQ